MKILSVAAGSVLLVAGLYVAVGERMAGTSADATLNARISTVRSPIDGNLTLSVRNVGTRIQAGQIIGEVIDARYDTARLLEVQRSHTAFQADLNRIKEQLAAVESARTQLQEQSTKYQDGRIRQVEARLAEANAALGAARSRLREAESALKRTTDLSARGLQTAITLERARSNHEVAQHDVESASQRLSFLRTELLSAKTGVFLGDSYNDAPSSLQRLRELELRSAELKAELSLTEARLAQAGQQVQNEKVRVNKLSSATLNADFSGLLWDVLSDSGEYIRRGQDVARIVDCSTLMITASVSERVFNTLTPGARAQFRLYDDNRVFNATIVRLGGSGAASLYTSLAVGATADHLKRFDITLAAPDIAQHRELECAVGRTGRLVSHPARWPQ